MATKTEPEYGTSQHYLGEKGETYFAWQNQGALFAGRIHRHKFQHLVKPTDTVLDFGCGGGELLYNLNCAQKIGVEINPVARESAQKLGITCYADLSDVPDGIADLIISNHALEHVPFPIGALRQLKTKLKPGGTLSLCVPIDNWRLHKRYDPQDRNHHLHTWTPQLLGNSLHEAGFETESVYARIHAWPGRWTVATYNRLGYGLFKLVCNLYGRLTGKGHEILAVAKPHQ